MSKDRRRRYDSVVEFAQAMEEAAFGGKKTRVGFTSPRYENAATVGDASRGDASARSLPEDAPSPSKPVAPTTFRTGAGELSRAIRSLRRKRVAIPVATSAAVLALLVGVITYRAEPSKPIALVASVVRAPPPPVVVPAGPPPQPTVPLVASTPTRKFSPPKTSRRAARGAVPGPTHAPARAATTRPTPPLASPPPDAPVRVACRPARNNWKTEPSKENRDALFDCLCDKGREVLESYCNELGVAARLDDKKKCQKRLGACQ